MIAVSALGRTLKDSHEACPSWCAEHVGCGLSEVLHCLDLPRAWGEALQPNSGERLTLVLERQDDECGAGEPQLGIQYLPNGRSVLACVILSISESEDFLTTMAQLVAQAQGTTAKDVLLRLASRA